jgi:hypothetical protein
MARQTRVTAGEIVQKMFSPTAGGIGRGLHVGRSTESELSVTDHVGIR